MWVYGSRPGARAPVITRPSSHALRTALHRDLYVNRTAAELILPMTVRVSDASLNLDTGRVPCPFSQFEVI